MATYHTTMRNQTAEVQTSVAAGCALKRLLQNLVGIEFVLLDRLVDADDILPDNTSRADVQVADLRVAHQALGQTNGQR